MELKTFGEAFKSIRKRVGKSQRDVAEHLDVDNGNISRVETGKQGLVFEKLLKLDEALNTPLSAIFAEAEGISTSRQEPIATSSKIERILNEIRSATNDGLTEAEEQALSEGLKAQLTWLKANRQPQQNIDMATGNPDATKLIDQYVKTAADSTPESMNLLKRQLDAQHEKQKTTGDVSNDEERQGDRSTGT